MVEEWRRVPIEGFEDLYQISNFGRVKRAHDRNGNRYVRGKCDFILKQRLSNKGYPVVMLWNYPKYRKVLIHRMVALAFIPNPANLPYVNHKDHGRDNNLVENL